MLRVLFGLAVVVAVFTVYAAVDCAQTPRSRVRGVAKPVWLLIIVLLPVLGVALWFFIGRAPDRGRAALRAPDDDPTFLRGLAGPMARPTPPTNPPRRTEQQDDDAEIRRYEQELANLDIDPDDDADGARRRD